MNAQPTGELAAVDKPASRVSMPMSVEVHEELMAWREATADVRQAAWDRLAALCDDDCTDPACRWFFIHGRRSGRPVGIVSAFSSALCTDCRVRLPLADLTYVPALGGYFCAACRGES